MDAKRPARRRAAYERMPPLERFLGKEGKETRGKRYYYFKPYMQRGLLGHLVAQPSPYTQRLVAAVGKEACTASRGLVEWEKGKTIESLVGTQFLLRNRRRILAQLAYAVADHVRLGVMHTDLHGSNIVISGSHSRKTRQPVRVKIIDYEMAQPVSAENLDIFMKHSDYHKALGSALAHLGRNKGEDERLKRYFEKKFLQRLEEKL